MLLRWIPVWLLGTCSLLCPLLAQEPRSVKIAALIADAEVYTAERTALELAVQYVNLNNIIPNATLECIINTTRELAFFEMVLQACHQSRSGVHAIIGPVGSSAVKAVSLVSGAVQIPQIAPVATDPMLVNQQTYPFLVRLSATDTVQSRVIADVIDHFGWQQMSILTSSDDYGTHGFIEFERIAGVKGWLIRTVQSFDPTEDPRRIRVRRQLQAIKAAGARIVLLNCLASFGLEVLRQAGDMRLTGVGWAWIVTDGVTGMTSFRKNETVPRHLLGLLGVKPVEDKGELFGDFMKLWSTADSNRYPGAGVWDIEAYPAKFVDAVLLFAFAYRDLLRAGQSVTGASVQCDRFPSERWEHGDTMLQYLRKVSEEGITSKILFTKDGTPTQVEFDIVNLRENGWQRVGTWNDTDGLTIDNSVTSFMGGGQVELMDDFVSDLRNRTLRIVTHRDIPFVMKNLNDSEGNPLHGNDQYSGLCIDLLKWLSEQLGFRYRLFHVADDKFGNKDRNTGRWNGVIGDLVYKKADMAVTDLTITAEREEDVDFTLPYIEAGSTFIMRKKARAEYNIMNFSRPFQPELWALVFITTLAVAIIQSVINKLSPYSGIPMDEDSSGPGESDEDSPYTFGESLWHSFAALIQQGPEFFPRAPSGRITSIFWGMGILIVIATYTANLAAFLTISRLETTIESVEDLAAQNEIVYGVQRDSATQSFFDESNIEPFKTMAAVMRARDSYVGSMDEGIRKAKTENYAYISDNVLLDYQANRDCTLRTVGRLFKKSGFGIALPKYSPYTEVFSKKILQARESGFLDVLIKKWKLGTSSRRQREVPAMRMPWLPPLGYRIETSECVKDKDKDFNSSIIGVDQMLGVFVLIYGGMGVAFVALLVEWVVACARDVSRSDPKKPQTICEAVSRRVSVLWNRSKCRSSCGHPRGKGHPLQQIDEDLRTTDIALQAASYQYDNGPRSIKPTLV
ncbi:GRIK3 [Branchiostoma lanceolatum]|uniref:GRIK3 protein n=1 Tax=Branchiostoma lanceolatum TaxID=7740 RepID=A0A8K0F0Q8_BRALA|nr:GRIK3 [Branchiostoma lanceolatum]